MTQDGEVGTWAAAGVGKFVGTGGAVSFRGALYYQIASQKLARLNSIAGNYEWDVDDDGNARSGIWEWI